MTSIILASPFFMTMGVSIWLGWQGRLRMFGLWLLACIMIAAITINAFLDGYIFSSVGMMLLAAVAMFLASGYGMGFVAARARMNGHADD